MSARLQASKEGYGKAFSRELKGKQLAAARTVKNLLVERKKHKKQNRYWLVTHSVAMGYNRNLLVFHVHFRERLPRASSLSRAQI